MAQSVQVPGVGTLQFPDGMSQSDMAAAIQKNYPEIHGKTAGEAPGAAPSTGTSTSGLDSALGVLKNAGKGLVGLGEQGLHLGSGIVGGLGGGLNYLGTLAATRGDTDAAKSVQDSTQNALTYQPRTDIGKGMTGASDSIMALPSEGLHKAGEAAYNATGSPLVGAGVETVGNAALQLLGAKAGLKAGSDATAAGEAAAAARNVQLGPKIQAFQAARQDGLTIPPTELAPETTNVAGKVGKDLVGLAGKTQNNTMAIFKNQDWANNAAKADIGGNAGQTLPQAVDAAHTAIDKGYSSLRDADQNVAPFPTSDGTGTVSRAAGPMPVTDVMRQQLSPQELMGDRSNGIGREIPAEVQQLSDRLTKPGVLRTNDLVSELVNLRQDARSNMTGDRTLPEKNLAAAQMKAADVLEDHFEEYLQNQPQLAGTLQQLRTQRAKVGNIEDAMNPDTGNLDPQKVAKAGKDGALTGNLQKIAYYANNFKSVMKSADGLQQPEGMSAFRTAVGAIPAVGYALAGHPAAGAAMGAIAGAGGGARALLNSSYYQNMLRVNPVKAQQMMSLAAKSASIPPMAAGATLSAPSAPQPNAQ